MTKLNQEHVSKFLNILLMLAILIAILGFIADLKNTLVYGGIDLRNRVIGARLLIDGIDPYYFHWHPGLSELLADPNHDPNSIVSKVTVTPTALTLYSVIARLPYFYQRLLWLFAQWVLLLISIVIFAKTSQKKFQEKLIIVIGLLFFSGSYFWRLHVERGQIYILYAFLLTLAYWLARQSSKYSQILGGVFIGFTVMLRPYTIFLSIPFLIYKKWNLVVGGMIGIVSGFLVSFIFADLSTWQSYFSAMKIHGRINSGLLKLPDTAVREYPQEIEGMKNLSSALTLPNYDIGFAINLKFLPPDLNLLINTIIMLGGISIIMMTFLNIKKHHHDQSISTEMLFLIGTLIVLVSEYFTPSSRNSYVDIQWLVPLSLVIIESKNFGFLYGRNGVFLLISLFFGVGFNWSFPENMLISSCAMLIYIILMTFSLASKDNKTMDSVELTQ